MLYSLYQSKIYSFKKTSGGKNYENVEKIKNEIIGNANRVSLVFYYARQEKAAKDKNTTDSEKRIQSHKNKAFIAQEKYDELAGITAILEEIHWRDVIEA